MYLPDDFSKYWACDIEGDGLPSQRVWCVCCVHMGSDRKERLRSYEEIREWFAGYQKAGYKFVFHNALGYDVPTLNRVVGTRLGLRDVIDTLLMSMMYSPSLENGHSLEAWGVRLDFPKGEFEDWSRWSQEMEDYCMNDSVLGAMVFAALVARMKKVGFTEDGIELEHRSWTLIQQQQKTGFAFNIEEAHALRARLTAIQHELTEKVNQYWPPVLQPVRTFQAARKKDGEFGEHFKRHREQYPRLVIHKDNTYTAWDYNYFNVSSSPQRVAKLLELGWVPYDDEYTILKTGPRKGQKGQPTPTKKGRLVPSLERFTEESGKEEVRLIAKYLEVSTRAGMVNTWIEAYNDRTGCIHGSLWLANTLRYKHSAPNTANIPAVRLDKADHPLLGEAGAWTYEARDLWTTRDPRTRVLVGVDAKGIQLRVLAHYLNNKDFIDAVLGGDPHSYNQEIGGFATRAIAKTFIYAFLLGCGDAKAGQIIGGSTKDGREVKKRFVGNFPGLSGLLDRLGGQVERTSRIILCDGTPLLVTKPHTRLGYLLQGDENRIMKRASVLVHSEAKRRSLDVLKTGDIHDEHQYDVLKTHAEEFSHDVCTSSFNRAGEYYKYNLPIDCSTKVGLTWAETH